MEAMQSMESHYTLSVDTVNGRPLVARIVRYGEKFGPNGSYENHNGMPIVEIRRGDPDVAELVDCAHVRGALTDVS